MASDIHIATDRRWDGDFLTVSKLIKDGAFGTITEFEDHYNQEMPSWINGWTGKEWEHGNGMMNALGTHSIDQVLKLFGRPASVTAFLRALRGVEDSEIDDAFTIILQYGADQKNLLVTVKTTVVSPMKEQIKFLVRGTEGSYIKVSTRPRDALHMSITYTYTSSEHALKNSTPTTAKKPQTMPSESRIRNYMVFSPQ